MNINELENLAAWFVEKYPTIHSLYQELMRPIQYNSTQQNKQPLESQLESLIEYLKSMKFDELSLQQIKLLRA